MARHKHAFVLLAALGLLAYACAAVALNVPGDIRVGYRGQAAIKMLDEMRRPFLAMKAAQNRIFDTSKPFAEKQLHDTEHAAGVLLAQYLDLARYNPALERDVRTLSHTFDRWVLAAGRLASQWSKYEAESRQAGINPKKDTRQLIEEHIRLMGEADSLFLATLTALGDGEEPMHADIAAGGQAGRVLFAMSVLLAAYLLAVVFFDQRSRARAQKEACERELRLQRLAHFDALTGLPNRALFTDRLVTAIAMARRQGTRAAVLFVDLDGFKQVNDQLGHDAGDLVLKEAARRLSACVREADTVSRFGGDEFVLLLRNITDPAHSTRVAKKVVASVDRPFDLGTQLRHIGASIGIAHYPDDGDDYQAVVKAADAAMYEAKKNETGSRALASGVLHGRSFEHH